MKGRVASSLVAVLLVAATLGVAQPARAVPMGPLAIAFGLDLIRNRASQPVESSTVGMPSLSVNVHWDDGGGDVIIGGANLGAQGLVVSAGCILEIEPALPVKPGISDLRAIVFYSQRAGFRNQALVRPDFKEKLLEELGLGEENDQSGCAQESPRNPWMRRPPPRARRSYSDDRPRKLTQLSDWDITEVDDGCLGWSLWLDTRELNGFYTPAADFFFRNGTVPSGFLNLSRGPRADSLRSIVNLAVVRPEEIEAGLNSPGVQRALQYFSGGEFYVPPVTGGPSFRVTNPAVQAMIVESQPPPAQSLPPPTTYSQPGFQPRDSRPVPPFPTEGRDDGPRHLPAMPGERGEESDYWEQEIPAPTPAMPDPVAPAQEQVNPQLRVNASAAGYRGDLMRETTFTSSNPAALELVFFFVNGGRVLPVHEFIVRIGGRPYSSNDPNNDGVCHLYLEDGGGLSLEILYEGRVAWRGRMPELGGGLWLPIDLGE